MAETRVERRLAAILAADVVGFARLMELDEAGTIARLCRPGARRSWSRSSQRIVDGSSS